MNNAVVTRDNLPVLHTQAVIGDRARIIALSPAASAICKELNAYLSAGGDTVKVPAGVPLSALAGDLADRAAAWWKAQNGRFPDLSALEIVLFDAELWSAPQELVAGSDPGVLAVIDVLAGAVSVNEVAR